MRRSDFRIANSYRCVSPIWDIIMYLTNRFKTDIEKIKAASEAQGRVEGKAEAYQVWADWYHRQENARARGIPFDEPPPSLNGDKTKE